MEIKNSIIQAFSKKGYFLTSPITKRQFHIVMNSLMNQSSSNKLFNQNITGEIWKQVIQKVGKSQKEVQTQELILTLIDAIQILTNRIVECQQIVQSLKQQLKKFQEEMRYGKIQIVQNKIDSITKDLEQFNADFKMLTHPFLSEINRTDMKKQAQLLRRKTSISKTSSLKKIQTIENNQVLQFSMKMKQKFDSQYVKEIYNGKKIDKASVYQEKRCGLYFLIFLMILQLSVCILKFNFVNLIIFLIGFLILLEEKFMPSMTQIAFYSCIFSVLIDTAWLFLFSGSYLNSFLNSGLKHELKAYFQYIWFTTLLQSFLKVIYIYFIRQYKVKSEILVQIQQRQSRQRDRYIPEIRNFSKQQQKNQARSLKKRVKAGQQDDDATIN